MNGKKWFSIAGILVIVAATAWLGHYFYLRHIYVISEDAFQKANITSISTQDVSGKIVKLYAKEFSKVKKGNPLFEIDSSLYKKQVESLEKKIEALNYKKLSLKEKLSKIEKQLPQQVKMVADKLKGEKEKLSILENKEKLYLTEYETAASKAKSAVKAAETGVEAAKTDLERWKNQYERFKKLYEKGVISRQQYEQVKAAFKGAEFKYQKAIAELEAAKENLKSALSLRNKVNIVKKEKEALKTQISATEKELKIAKANLKSIEELKNSISALEKEIEANKTQLEKAKILLSHTVVKSPVDGVVAKKWREKGEFITPGLPVYSIYDPESFYVLAWIEEDKIKEFKAGSKVKAELEVCGETFDGEVSSIGTAAGSTFALIPRDTSQGEFTKVTQRIPVKIKLKNVPLNCIKPGTSVTVYIHKD